MALSRARLVSSTLLRSLLHPHSQFLSTGSIDSAASKAAASGEFSSMMNEMFTMDPSSQIGTCMPLGMMRIGTQIHNIEIRPGQGGKLVRAAGTSAKILTEPSRSTT